jgi:hypothetical protein
LLFDDSHVVGPFSAVERPALCYSL